MSFCNCDSLSDIPGHRIHKSVNFRESWLRQLQIKDPCSKRTAETPYICSCHFENGDVGEEIEISEEEYLKVIKRLVEEKDAVESQRKKLEDNLATIFNPDSMQQVINPEGRVSKWSDNTIFKCIILLSLFSIAGYNTLRKVFNLPFPCVTSLKDRIKPLIFGQGIVHEVIAGLKISGNESDDIDMLLVVDETAISSRYEKNTDKIVGGVSSQFASDEDLKMADKVLAILLKSLRTNSRQVVAYYFTGKSVTGNQLSAVISELIVTIEKETKYRIHGVVSDMGSCNVGAWSNFGINVKTVGRRDYVGDHPVPNEFGKRELFWFPDSSHLLKNIRNCFMNSRAIILPKWFCLQNDLKSNRATYNVLQQIINLNETQGINLQPKLKRHVLFPVGFKKMKVAYAARVFSQDTVHALNKLNNWNTSNPGTCDADECKATLAFIQLISDWWDLLSNTESEHDKSVRIPLDGFKLAEQLKPVNDFMESVGIEVIDKSNNRIRVEMDFKPWRAGTILLNHAALAFMKHLDTLSPDIEAISLGSFVE